MHDPRARFNRYNRSRLLLTLHFEILKRFSLRLLRSWRSQTTFHFSHFICSFICSQLQRTVLQGKQLGSPGVASGKESTLPMQEMQETRVPSLDGKDPPKKGMATYSSVLAWEIPRTEEPGGLQSMGLQSRTWLSMQAPGVIVWSSSWHSEAGPKAPSWTFLAWIPFCQILGTLHHFLLRWCIFGHNKWIHGTSRTDLGIDTISNPEAKSEI